MFGFEKKKKPALLVFDLEKDLQDNKKQQSLMKAAEKHIADLKNLLREGAKSEDFESLGQLLQAYAALLKILNRINKK